MQGRYLALALFAVGAAFGGGWALERFYLNTAQQAESGPKIAYWVAPMDPNFRRDGPGKSPMGMDLVPVYEGDEPSGDPNEIELSPVEINAIGVRTAVARMSEISDRIDTVGFVAFDDHRTSHIHMRVDGWIEDLSVRAVGDPVRKGDLLFKVYAPEITIASFELMRALERGLAREAEIARTKLRNFGVTTRQIHEMEGAKKQAEHIRVYASQDGVVTDLAAADGMFLKPETRALTLSDLSSVWVLVDVFERDIGRLSDDMTVEARFEALPGKVFQGEIDYVYPELDKTTRTLPVRLRFDNDAGLLRPNMYGSVSLAPRQTEEVVTVPSEAVIRTGRADRVILRTGERTFKPRLVTMGLRDNFGEGARTEIVQGLAPGDVVVASAQFLIDSESALSAGLMRFAPTEADPAAGKGILVSLDRDAGKATIDHQEIAALDWPSMVTEFSLDRGALSDRLEVGQIVKFNLVRGADGLLHITTLAPDDGIDAEGTGIVKAITPDGKLSLSHDPIPALGWPAMEMDLSVARIDPNSVPLNIPIRFSLAKGRDGLFTVVGIDAVDAGGGGQTDAMASAPSSAPPIEVEGVIESINTDARTATIAHGPIAAIGMPGMTMEFAIAPSLDPSALPVGTPMDMVFSRPDGLIMVLTEVKGVKPIFRVKGTIEALDPANRKAEITHGPIAEIGMPGMTMEFPIADTVSFETLTTDRETTFLMERQPDFTLTVVGVADDQSAEPQQ
ncbi:MAG: efflux RND transporter periplasmic adaptor subunit [Alphaproteobacteria bacterium]|nr:efflux RND transporter periplasmic adaptor subunit [Alphaproteobacteria bacterium]